MREKGKVSGPPAMMAPQPPREATCCDVFKALFSPKRRKTMFVGTSPLLSLPSPCVECKQRRRLSALSALPPVTTEAGRDEPQVMQTKQPQGQHLQPVPVVDGSSTSSTSSTSSSSSSSDEDKDAVTPLDKTQPSSREPNARVAAEQPASHGQEGNDDDEDEGKAVRGEDAKPSKKRKADEEKAVEAHLLRDERESAEQTPAAVDDKASEWARAEDDGVVEDAAMVGASSSNKPTVEGDQHKKLEKRPAGRTRRNKHKSGAKKKHTEERLQGGEKSSVKAVEMVEAAADQSAAKQTRDRLEKNSKAADKELSMSHSRSSGGRRQRSRHTSRTRSHSEETGKGRKHRHHNRVRGEKSRSSKHPKSPASEKKSESSASPRQKGRSSSRRRSAGTAEPT